MLYRQAKVGWFPNMVTCTRGLDPIPDCWGTQAVACNVAIYPAHMAKLLKGTFGSLHVVQ